MNDVNIAIGLQLRPGFVDSIAGESNGEYPGTFTLTPNLNKLWLTGGFCWVDAFPTREPRSGRYSENQI